MALPTYYKQTLAWASQLRKSRKPSKKIYRNIFGSVHLLGANGHRATSAQLHKLYSSNAGRFSKAHFTTHF